MLKWGMAVNVLVAPDSFKGSLTARSAAEAMASGIRRADPDCTVRVVPIADGGEGTAEAMIAAQGGRRVEVEVRDPLGRIVTAAYGVLPDGTVVMDVASTSGLGLVASTELDVWNASTHGVGDMLRHALDAGFRQFVVGLGGSATNDCGMGMLQALGARLWDAAGQEITRATPDTCRAVRRLDLSLLHPAIREASIRVACDVANPLCGPEGATAVYGPQKGVRPEWIPELDAVLFKLGSALTDASGVDVLGQLPGAGAAGGLGAAFVAGLGAKLVGGIELVLSMLDFDSRLRSADLVFTGEGRTDAQTAFGKAVLGVATAAARAGVPVICLSGAVTDDARVLYQRGVTALFSVAQQPASLAEAQANAADWAARSAESAMRLFLAGRQSALKSREPQQLR